MLSETCQWTYTKFKCLRKRVPRLKVVSSQVLSIDLADMQQFATTRNRKLGRQVSFSGSGHIDLVSLGNGSRMKDFERLYWSTEKKQLQQISS